LPATCLDVLVMPLVAFDRRGTRLGMGGGYFDRALAGAASRPLRVGVGFDFQEVNEIPAEPWDVPLALIVTDRRVLRPRRQAGRSIA
jgi:5-formyltetrahydrofolate cyclo-ligase